MPHAKKLAFGFAAFVAIAFAPFAHAPLAYAQDQNPPLVVKPLTGGVYWTQGGVGGNTGIIVGKDGVIVVDAKTTPDSAKEMLGDIAKLTTEPVNTVIITHSDADHVNGLAAFPAGLTIIAQENCKKEMEASEGSKNPAPADRMPTKTVGNKENTTIDGERIDMLHVAPAHTSGDLIVYLPAQKIVFTGDIIATQFDYPIIHLEKHGSSEGWVETAKALVALNATTYVPGHGDLQTKEDIQKRIEKTEARRAEIKKLVAEGKSLEQVKEALGEANAPPSRFPTFTEVVYKEFSTKS